MNVDLVTDLSKIGLSAEIKRDGKELSYNLMCVPLDQHNQVVDGEYICDFRNPDSILRLKKLSDVKVQFELNLRDLSNKINRLSFFVLGNPTGTYIEGIDFINFDLLDLNSNKVIASIEVPNLTWKVKCINVCYFNRTGESWVFKEVCKKIKMQDFYWKYDV